MNNPEIDKYGTKRWLNNKGQWHRENGPAIEWANSSKEWFINGKRHRENGPAIERRDGYKAWYYNNEFIGASYKGFTQEDFERFLKIKEYW